MDEETMANAKKIALILKQTSMNFEQTTSRQFSDYVKGSELEFPPEDVEMTMRVLEMNQSTSLSRLNTGSSWGTSLENEGKDEEGDGKVAAAPAPTKGEIPPSETATVAAAPPPAAPLAERKRSESSTSGVLPRALPRAFSGAKKSRPPVATSEPTSATGKDSIASFMKQVIDKDPKSSLPSVPSSIMKQPVKTIERPTSMDLGSTGYTPQVSRTFSQGWTQGNPSARLDPVLVQRMMHAETMTAASQNRLPIMPHAPKRPNHEVMGAITLASIGPRVANPTKRRRHNNEPSQRIYVTPADMDVYCGRGGRTNHHHGNKRYLAEKDAMQDAYFKAEKNDKTRLSQELVNKVHEWGGRFLKLEEETGKWYLVTNTAARKKASQSLREVNTAEVRAEKRSRYKKYVKKKKPKQPEEAPSVV